MTVKLPDGRELAEPEVVVEDLFIVALGDSFASGESNPDRPVQFSAGREMVYDPTMLRAGRRVESAGQACHAELRARRQRRSVQSQGAAAAVHGRRGGRALLRPRSPEFVAAFEKASARWLSRDCHRSQYGYPFRVAIELALENRHRAVTLASFTCSGAEVTEGLFLDMAAREGASEIPGGKVRAQLDQLSDLICRGPRSQSAAMRCRATPTAALDFGADDHKTWCPPQSRKRAIDVVLMSIGGNDVGFSALAAYSMTENMADLAPIAGLTGSSSRFGPQVSRAYLEVLDERMKAVKEALHDGFGVDALARRANVL